MAKPIVTIKDVIPMGACLTGTIVHGHPFIPVGSMVITSRAIDPFDLEGEPNTVETKNTVYKVENWV